MSRSLPSRCSSDALTSVQSSLPALEDRILEHIRMCGAKGCTDEEGQLALGISGNTWRPCRLNLEKIGEVGITAGNTRKTLSGRDATVWYVAPLATTLRFVDCPEKPKSAVKETQDLLNEINVLLNHAGAKGDTYLARISNLIEERDVYLALLEEERVNE